MRYIACVFSSSVNQIIESSSTFGDTEVWKKKHSNLGTILKLLHFIRGRWNFLNMMRKRRTIDSINCQFNEMKRKKEKWIFDPKIDEIIIIFFLERNPFHAKGFSHGRFEKRNPRDERESFFLTRGMSRRGSIPDILRARYISRWFSSISRVGCRVCWPRKGPCIPWNKSVAGALASIRR